MELLTEKCKIEFEAYLQGFNIDNIPLSGKLGIIIDFLDSKGYYVEVEYQETDDGKVFFEYHVYGVICHLGDFIVDKTLSRTDAIIKAIQVANEDYNNQ